MEYELYIDVFFLVNFMMDYLMLLLVHKALACTVPHGRVLLGALAGAVLSCAIVCVPMPPAVKMVCMHTMVNTGMLAVGLKIRKWNIFLKACILLYLSGFLLGGILTWLSQYLGGYFRIGALFFAFTVCSYFLASRGMVFLEKLWKLRECRCEVTLYLAGKSLRMSAMVDSGNGLRDGITGKPVHIIGKKAMEKLTEKDFSKNFTSACAEIRNGNMQGVRYIPYQTIQEKEGVLPVIAIDKMCVHSSAGDEEKMITAPLLGISEQNSFGGGTFEMILHPGE